MKSRPRGGLGRGLGALIPYRERGGGHPPSARGRGEHTDRGSGCGTG